MFIHDLRWLLSPTLLILFLFTSTDAFSDAVQRGLDIATEADRRDTGFIDSSADLEMVLRNAQGESATRKLTVYVLEGSGSGDRSITKFTAPRDIKDTALLTWSNINDPDDQWLYLPSISRVKRISSKNISGSFVGSEFAYEDLSAQEVAKFNYTYLSDDRLNDTDMFVIERLPIDKNSGYSKNVLWIDKEHYNTHKIEYYDRSKRLLKTLVFEGYRQYLSKYWRSKVMTMSNHQTGKSTVLTWQEYTFGTGLNPSIFTKNRLKSLR